MEAVRCHKNPVFSEVEVIELIEDMGKKKKVRVLLKQIYLDELSQEDSADIMLEESVYTNSVNSTIWVKYDGVMYSGTINGSMKFNIIDYKVDDFNNPNDMSMYVDILSVIDIII